MLGTTAAGSRQLIAPAKDQIEVTLIGPGFGECSLIHIGSGRWVVIDSCIDGTTARCAALDYLEGIGVSPANVSLVVITHWHDDHVGGIAQLLRECDRAVVACSAALGLEEFRKLIRVQVRARSLATSSGTDEIAEALQFLVRAAEDNRLRFAHAATKLISLDVEGLWHCEVWSLSPSAAEYARFLSSLVRLMPDERQTMRRIPSPSPNDQATAVVVLLDRKDGSGSVSLLFGSDLEETGNPAMGWSAVIASRERPQDMSTLFKVAHHGSITGHHHDIWSKMLIKDACAILTPFQLGGVRLPTPADVRRIARLTTNAFITSNPASRRRSGGRDRVVEKTIQDFNISLAPAQPEIGRITLRRTLDATSWTTDLGGSARSLSELAEAGRP